VNRGGNLSKWESPDARDKANRGFKNYSRSKTSTDPRSDSSWGKRSGRGRAACSGSTRAQMKSPGGSRATDGQPRRSCSTSVPGCSHGSCDRNHRTSSRWSGEHLRSHRHHHRSLHDRRRSRQQHRRSHRPGSSCGQCDRPGRTCSTLGWGAPRPPIWAPPSLVHSREMWPVPPQR